MHKRLWCEESFVMDGPEKVIVHKKGWFHMELKETEIMKIKVNAWVCPSCNKATWLPGESIRPFLDGLNKK